MGGKRGASTCTDGRAGRASIQDDTPGTCSWNNRSQRLTGCSPSHELRSSLIRLQLAVGLARRDRSGVMASLDRIEYEERRLDSVVRELLSLARARS